MEKREKILALDIGGVCVSLHPERALVAMGYASFSDVPPELFVHAGLLETGKIDAAEFAARVRELTGKNNSDAEFFTIWNAIIGAPLPGMETLVKELSESGWKLVFFSDTSRLHLDEVRRNFPAAALIAEGVYSFDAGARKPEAPMFECFEARFGRPDCYVDDREVCLAGGVAHGWPVLQFRNAESLREHLLSF